MIKINKVYKPLEENKKLTYYSIVKTFTDTILLYV
jgi:hypothetical protein